MEEKLKKKTIFRKKTFFEKEKSFFGKKYFPIPYSLADVNVNWKMVRQQHGSKKYTCPVSVIQNNTKDGIM